jgi:hypothetical protein
MFDLLTKGVNGIYIANKRGNIMNSKTGNILTPHLCKNGYMSVRFGKREEVKQKYIHRLIAENFISNPNNYKYVHHKDGNKLNNSIRNLQWISIQEHNKICISRRKNEILR